MTRLRELSTLGTRGAARFSVIGHYVTRASCR